MRRLAALDLIQSIKNGIIYETLSADCGFHCSVVAGSVPLGSAKEVIAVDAASDQITAQYQGVENPHGLVATPDGAYLVAGSLTETPAPEEADSDTPTSKLFLIHPAHGHVMLTIPVARWTHHQAILWRGGT